MVRVLLLATLLLIACEVRAETPAAKPPFSSKLVIYLAKGPANSCGPGCDHWIAVEGQVDVGAAARVRRFLAGVKDTQRPIYFHSPGGAVDQSFLIGRLLRSRKAIARVGQTIVAACAAGTQIDAACLKIKDAGGELDAELTTHNAMCNSACGYLFLGATTREVAPDAVIGVHNSRYTFSIHGQFAPDVVAAFKQRHVAIAEQERTAFIAAMGIKRELGDLIRTVKFETPHALTRSELYRFGIDTRAQPETLWTLEKGPRPFARKLALRKDEGGSFRMMEWRLFCENKDRARLMFAREFDADAVGKTTIVLMAGPEQSVAFGRYPAHVGKFEVWSNAVPPDTFKAMLAASRLDMGESTSTAEGKANNLSTFAIDTVGLEPAWTQMLTACQAPPTNAKPVWPPVVNAVPSPTLGALPSQ